MPDDGNSGEATAWVDPDAAEASGFGGFDTHLTGFDRLTLAGGSVVDAVFTNTGNPNDGVGGPLDLSGATFHVPSRDTIAHFDPDAGDASGADAFDTHLTGLDVLDVVGQSVIDVRFTNADGPNGPLGMDPGTFDPSTLGPGGTNAHQVDGTTGVLGGDQSAFIAGLSAPGFTASGFTASGFTASDSATSADLQVSIGFNQFESLSNNFDQLDSGMLEVSGGLELDAGMEAGAGFAGEDGGPLPFP